jgi:thioesterase domain-containing protein
LAGALPDGVPLYAVQSPSMDGTPPAPNVESMAEEYAARIRTVQPHGPYHLLGWSFGGVVAQEIAAQLVDAGEQVGAVVILDTYPQDRTKPVPPMPADALDRRIEWIRTEASHLFGSISEEEVVLLARIFQNNLLLGDRHDYSRYAGDALLLVAANSHPEGTPTVERWAPYITGTITETRIPCRHPEISQPRFLDQVWAAVENWLARP